MPLQRRPQEAAASFITQHSLFVLAGHRQSVLQRGITGQTLAIRASASQERSLINLVYIMMGSCLIKAPYVSLKQAGLIRTACCPPPLTGICNSRLPVGSYAAQGDLQLAIQRQVEACLCQTAASASGCSPTCNCSSQTQCAPFVMF